MGRDWAPVEHYLVEQRQIKQGHGSIWDFLDGLAFHHKDGTVEKMHSDEEMALRKQFPELGRLLMDDFPELYERLSKIRGGIDLLHAKDDELARFIETDINGTSDSLVVRWFFGQLDEHFYYAEKNNRAFVEGVVSEAKELSGEQKRLYEEYKQEWCEVHGITPEMIATLRAEYDDDCANRRFTGTFEEYELDWGYNGGEVYACFEEFLDNEYQEMKQNAVDNVLAIAEERSAETVDGNGAVPEKNNYDCRSSYEHAFGSW